MSDDNTEQIIEAYCVRDRKMVEMLHPEAVWTSRGMPGTRGVCPECGGTVFRMGATYLHEGLERPTAVVLKKNPRRQPPKIAPNTVYVNYAEADEETAQQIAADLNKIGMTTWLHDPTPDDVKWAGGVHPALKDCDRMVFVMSASSMADAQNGEAWAFFRKKRKPVVIAQMEPEMSPPDDLRRSPRFDFATQDYKRALREMLQALAR
ncbi:MAG: TIR domain-containing protein [Chloroflexota bacterium]